MFDNLRALFCSSILILSVVSLAVVGTVFDQRRAKREEGMGPSSHLPGQ
jgi:hypothetical protein